MYPARKELVQTRISFINWIHKTTLLVSVIVVFFSAILLSILMILH